MGKNNIFVNKKLKDFKNNRLYFNRIHIGFNIQLMALLLFILNPIFAHSVLKIIIRINQQNLCN